MEAQILHRGAWGHEGSPTRDLWPLNPQAATPGRGSRDGNQGWSNVLQLQRGCRKWSYLLLSHASSEECLRHCLLPSLRRGLLTWGGKGHRAAKLPETPKLQAHPKTSEPSVTCQGRPVSARHFRGSSWDRRGTQWPGPPQRQTAAGPASCQAEPGPQTYINQQTLWLYQLSETGPLPNWSLKAHTAQAF